MCACVWVKERGTEMETGVFEQERDRENEGER